MELTYFLITISLYIIGEVLYLIYRLFRKNKNLEFIHENFGFVNDNDLSKDDLAFIRLQAKHKPFKVDDITWNDLQLNEIFQKMNSCQSRCGDVMLYRYLRNPLTNLKELQKRQAMQDYFISHPEQRKAIQSSLFDIGRCSATLDFSKLRFGKTQYYTSIALSIALFASIIISIFNPFFFANVFILGIANAILANRIAKMLEEDFEQVQFAIRITTGIQAVTKHAKHDLDDWVDIQECNQAMKGKNPKLFDLFHSPDGFLLLILSQLFLCESICYFRFVSQSVKHPEALQNAHDILGEIDATIAISSYRCAQPITCTPVFNEKRAINAIGMIHPLLKKPVANDLSLDQCLLVSGSNASGKSTFLKMVAINALFAQTFHFAFATSYESTFFKIMTSMSLRDSISNEDSYFMSEIKAIKRILDRSNDKIPTLCVIDEILRGTNTNERIAASGEILSSLTQKNAICLSATHDIELTMILKNHFMNVHFNEQLLDGQMHFDYLLKTGPSDTRNAIQLLSLLGYGDDLVERADRRLQYFEKTQRWNKEVI